MMLDWLGEKKASELVMEGMIAVTKASKTLTPDLGGTANTVQAGDALRDAILQMGEKK